MKKILSLSLILTLLLSGLCILPASADELPEGVKSGEYWYNVLDDGTAEITDYLGDDQIITVPAEIEDYKVTSIGMRAFLSATATEVILPDTVTTVRTAAFRLMRNLESIVIPESVTSIEQSAFEYCESLSEIAFPESLEALGRNVLNFTPYYENPDNWENGILYAGSCLVVSDESLSGVCEIREGTTLIADHAFENRTEITGFVFPDSLKHIGSSSFTSCFGLKSLTLPEGVVSIGRYAFFNCKALESITLPESMVSINESAFEDCEVLKNITLPQTLEKIGENILEGTVYYNNPDNWQDGGLYLSGALIGTDPELKGECKIKDGTYIISNSVFSGCYNLTSVIIPDSVRIMGEGALGWHYNLENVRLSKSLTEIPKNAFRHCSKLSRINIPEGVEKISDYAFNGCDNLTSITIPESVTEIGIRALGYFDETKETDFEICGKAGTAAEKYASANGFTFKATDYSYKDEALALIGIPADSYYYEEYEYFSSTADESAEATPDFVLINAFDSWSADTEVIEYFGDYILHSSSLTHPDSGFGYYVYLPKTNEIYTLRETFDKNVNGVYSVFTECIIGELLGDANNDEKLTIQDATLIQKHIAGTGNFAYYSTIGNFTRLVADFNRDGKINIRDATAIQKRLAGLDFEEIEHTVLGITQLSHPLDENISTKAIAKSSEELMDILSRVTDNSGVILHDKQLDEEYFEEKNVVVIAEVLTDVYSTKTCDSVKSNGITLRVNLTNHFDGVSRGEAVLECVLIEVDKTDTDYLSEIEVRENTALLCP